MVRSNDLDGIYEHVDIDCFGKQGDAVCCQVGISNLNCIRSISNEPILEYLATQLQRKATPDQNRHTDWIGGFVTQIYGFDINDAIDCARIAIAMYGSTIHPEYRGFAGVSATRNLELTLR